MLGGCVRRVLVLGLLVGVILGAWLYRDRLRLAWQDLRGTREQVIEPSPELAAIAEQKLAALLDGSQTVVALSSVELQSLLLYRYEGVFPAFLGSPRVELREDQVRLRASVPVDKLPRVADLDEIIAFLPDTTELTVAGQLLPLESGRIGFGIDEVTAATIPLPHRLVPRLLEQIGRQDEPGLPPDAIALQLPRGVAAAYVRADSLYLLAPAARKQP